MQNVLLHALGVKLSSEVQLAGVAWRGGGSCVSEEYVSGRRKFLSVQSFCEDLETTLLVDVHNTAGTTKIKLR